MQTQDRLQRIKRILKSNATDSPSLRGRLAAAGKLSAEDAEAKLATLAAKDAFQA